MEDAGGQGETRSSYRAGKGEHRVRAPDMFRPYDISIARKSMYIDRNRPFPPRSQEDNAYRQKVTDSILHQIGCLHTTNAVPEGYMNSVYFRQTFSDEEVSPHMEWLEASIGETKWLIVHGLRNPKNEICSKLVLGTLSNRTLIIDLRTVSTSGGIPDRVRSTLESGRFVLGGFDIHTHLQRINVSAKQCIDVKEVISATNEHPANFFKLPQTDLPAFGHWLYPLLWFEEYMGFLTPEEFAELEVLCPHPMIRKWPWSKDSRSKQWGTLLSNTQLAHGRNCILADLVSMLTYTLMELGTNRVRLGVRQEADEATTLVLPPSISWLSTCAKLCERFQKEVICTNRQINLLAPCRMYPSTQEAELARIIPCCMTQEEEREHWASLFHRTRKVKPLDQITLRDTQHITFI